jgi:hypothetical protein
MADSLFLGRDSVLLGDIVSMGVCFLTFQRNAVLSKHQETHSDTVTFQKN